MIQQISDTQRLKPKTTQHMSIYTNTYVRALQIHDALKVCKYDNILVLSENFYQWELGKFQTRYRVSFIASIESTYAEVSSKIVDCMKQLKL